MWQPVAWIVLMGLSLISMSISQSVHPLFPLVLYPSRKKEGRRQEGNRTTCKADTLILFGY